MLYNQKLYKNRISIEIFAGNSVKVSFKLKHLKRIRMKKRIVPKLCMPVFRLIIISVILLSLLQSAEAAVQEDDPKSPEMYSVAHMGYNNRTHNGYNLFSAMKSAKRYGFNAVECDVLRTRDGVFVLSHDDTIRDSRTGRSYTIYKCTWKTLRRVSYHGSRLATLEEVLKYCSASGMYVYLDKIGRYTGEKTWESLFNLVGKYNMQDRATWLLSKETTAKIILKRYPEARIGFLILNKKYLNAVIKRANHVKTSENDVFVCFMGGTTFPPKLLKSRIKGMKKGITFEVFIYGGNKNLHKSYLPIVSGITSDYYSIPMLK